MRYWSTAPLLLLLWCLLLIVIFGCETVAPPPPPVPPLPLLPPPAVEAPPPELPREDRVAMLDSEPAWVQEDPLKVERQAAKRAMIKPSSVGFQRGMLVFPYRPYTIYWLDVSLRGSLHVELQPGEEIRLVSGLRPTDWTVQRDDASTKTEASHLSITPHETDLSGRMTLITSLGVYYLDLHSRESDGVYGVSWRHPRKAAP
jgi:type IV secretory pathway VirB9-like protein